ncbi:MAG: hypothetical protein CMK72_01185 [Pseudomonadaceae bacterium]|nr:hypothetical protein [Pseudomonadaceae bacterium]HCP54562.1 hypothetical protein [Pseudomonas sp.]|tara:strand:- start:197 stop:649 length:453 start_codon:yes stop_codon:yes gene_type:complete
MTDLAPIEEDKTSADAWAGAAEACCKTGPFHIHQTELERLEAEFLARGWSIQQVGIGARSEPVMFNNRARKTADQFAETRKAHEANRVARLYEQDAELIEMIAAVLPRITKKQELAKACNCSDDRVQRILRTYFTDDPVAQRFMRKCQAA